MCFNHGWKGAISDRRRKWGIFLRSRYTAFSVTIFFDRAIRSAHTVEKVDFFSGMRGSDCSIEKLFEAHRTSHHPRKHTITPYNSSDAGLTASILLLLLLLLLLLTASQRGTFCSPPASNAYRHPMAAVRVIDYLFAKKTLLLLCSL